MTQFGLNYKSLNKVALDALYFDTLGINHIRVHVPYAPIPWTASAQATWRNVAKQFHDLGKHVMWGFSSLGPTILTASNWNNYANSVIAEAAYCQANNICDLFIIGNELEQFNDNTTLTDAQLRTNIRTLGASVKAVFSGPIIYCAEYGSASATFGTYRWAQEGKGTIDYFGANLYGNYDPITQVYFPRYAVGQGGIPVLKAAFGTSFILSEFGVDGSAEMFNIMPEVRKEMELARYIKFIEENDIPQAYLYQYRAFNDDDDNDSFFLRYSNDDFSLAWNSFVSSGGRSYYGKGQPLATVGTSGADYIVGATNANVKIAEALAEHDSIYIQNGVYNFNDSLRVPSGKFIIGESKTGVVLRMNSGVNKSVIVNDNAGVGGITTDVTIKNLTIDQQGALQTGGGGLVVTGVQRWQLEDVVIKKSYRFNFLALHQSVGVPNNTGTLTFTKDSNVVTGSGTLFNSELAVGDILKSAGAQFGRVEAIISDTSLVLTMPWGYTTESGVTYKTIQPNNDCHFRRVRFEGTLAPADANGGIDASGYGLFDNGILEDCEALDANDGGCGFVPDHARNVQLIRPVSHGNNNSGISLETCEDLAIIDPITYGNGDNGIQFISGTSRCTVLRGDSYSNTKDGYVVTYNTPNAGVPRDNKFIDCQGSLNGGYAFRNNGADTTEFGGLLGKNNNTGGAIINQINSRVPVGVYIHDSNFYDDRAVKAQQRGVYIVSATDTTVRDTTALNSLHTIAGIVDQGTNTTQDNNTT